jgi:hypothetical protein
VQTFYEVSDASKIYTKKIKQHVKQSDKVIFSVQSLIFLSRNLEAYKTAAIQAKGTAMALRAVPAASCCLRTSSVTASHPAVSGSTSAKKNQAGKPSVICIPESKGLCLHS